MGSLRAFFFHYSTSRPNLQADVPFSRILYKKRDAAYAASRFDYLSFSRQMVYRIEHFASPGKR